MAARTRTTRRRAHFRNEPFLNTLGEHCRKLRTNRGLSIDRFSKESEQLSPSVIHRLEAGTGAVTVSALVRYAETLGIHPRELFDFPWEADDKDTPVLESDSLTKKSKIVRVVAADDPAARKKAFQTFVPLYSLRAAAGAFGGTQPVEPEGWVELSASVRGDRQLFVARAVGRSMEPRIRSGDLCLFRSNPSGTRQGKIVLVQYRGSADPETGGSYTVKRYSSATVHRGDEALKQIVLSPLNPEFEPFVLHPESPGDFRVVAELIDVL